MEPASTVYEAALVAHRRPGSNRPGVIVPHLADELMAEEPSHIDLVVRRRDSGDEIVRTPADLGTPDDLLATVQGDLASMSAEQFLEEWRMPDGA